MDVPFCQRPTWPADISPSRFASLVRTERSGDEAIGLLGLPDDTGVGMNGGRLGAAQGPASFRAALSAYGSASASDWPTVFDAGDVQPGGSLNETHDRVSKASAAIVEAGMLPVAIGGGHDLTFAFVRGVIRASAADTPWAGVYLDAHLDVRAEPGSGMPFRSLVEQCGVTKLDVVGLDRHSNTREHVAWFESNGGHIDRLTPDTLFPDTPTFFSVDLDVIDQAFSPGVSARNPAGWAPELACQWSHRAGRCKDVRCFDIMELSPPHDDSGRTSRLAARLFLEFLIGYGERA